MGDMSEYRGLIVAGTLLACFAILGGAIPPTLYAAEDRHVLDPPDYFELGDLYYYTQTMIHYFNTTGGAVWWVDATYYFKDVDLGEWDVDLYYKLPNASGTYNFFLVHIHTEWWIIPSDHQLEWFNENKQSRGTNILISELLLDFGSDSSIDYTASCDHTTYYVQIAFDDTVYSDASDAWDHGQLAIFFGVRFDDVNTGYNAMNLIASILFFQMPDVHGAINLLLAIPMWIAIGYISIILILRAIDALPFT